MGLPVLPLALGLQAMVQQEPLLPYVITFVVLLAAVMFSIARSQSSRQQLKTMANQQFNMGCIVLFATIAMHFAVVFTLPAWSFAALGIESGMMGMYFSLIAGSQVISGPLFGKFIDRYGDKQLRLYAVVAISLSFTLMVFYLNRISLAVALAILGTGFAAAQLIAQKASLLASAEDSRALAMGVFSSYRSVGGLSGNALAALILGSYVTITAGAGVQVLEWAYGLFILPMGLAMLALRKNLEARG